MYQLIETLKSFQVIAFDTETDGVVRDSRIIGFSVAASVDEAYYIVLHYWDVATQSMITLETDSGSKDFLESLVGKDLIMQNAIFDCMMVENNYGVKLMPSLHTDTMLLAHLVNENRSVGLKELGVSLYGEDAKAEQTLMKESVLANGGKLTKACYELFKADSDLIAKYGAKDAILTLRIYYTLVPELYDQGLDAFFYDDEIMPLLKGATYDLNHTGLNIDLAKLEQLGRTLEAECLEYHATILHEIWPYVKDDYPGTGKTNHFNITSNTQVGWLLYEKMGNLFDTLTPEGKELCFHLGIKLPYSKKAKLEFIQTVKQNKDKPWRPYDKKYKTYGKERKVKDPVKYMRADLSALSKLAPRHKWITLLLKYKKNTKLLTTYVEGIKARLQFGVIYPSFLQHGTTSGRYSSRNPNFQNLPRDDKRIKSCVVARPGMRFVGADYSQLEPRVFASLSQDKRLMECFSSGEDFYSVIGAEVFGNDGRSLFKDEPGSFFEVHSEHRKTAKTIALAVTYGTTAPKLAGILGKDMSDAQTVIDNYLASFPSVHKLMLDSHEEAKKHGVVYSLFGRPRRIPEAKDIKRKYGNTAHEALPYEARTPLNLAVNHKNQSAAASIINRASIRFCELIKEAGVEDCHLVMTIHDELVAECKEVDALTVADILKEAMENTVSLPGVKLVAEPKIGSNLSELK